MLPRPGDANPYALYGCRAVLPRGDLSHARALQVWQRSSGVSLAITPCRLSSAWTAFGGGKTHALIALTHLGFRGNSLAAVTRGLLDAALLPAPGDIAVVGIAGDEIPVHKPHGTALAPYTLWGEIAYQIGGEALYRQVEADATSYAAPGRNYFEAILENRKVLILLDELAQYAARLETAIPDAGTSLPPF